MAARKDEQRVQGLIVPALTKGSLLHTAGMWVVVC